MPPTILLKSMHFLVKRLTDPSLKNVISKYVKKISFMLGERLNFPKI